MSIGPYDPFYDRQHWLQEQQRNAGLMQAFGGLGMAQSQAAAIEQAYARTVAKPPEPAHLNPILLLTTGEDA